MSLQPGHGGLEIEAVGGVTVVKFRDRQILSDEAVQALGRQLPGLAAGSGPCHLLLDFGNVERLSSAVLGQVVALERAVRRIGGRLVLCGLRPDLAYVLTITRLDKYLDLYPSEEEALQSLL
jgi:stage II sporulation protein AA (anti-sigma F factor antagonist)